MPILADCPSLVPQKDKDETETHSTPTSTSCVHSSIHHYLATRTPLKLHFSIAHYVFDKMSQWACVSATNLNLINTQNPQSTALSFHGSEIVARNLRFLGSQASIGKRPRKGVLPLKVCFFFLKYAVAVRLFKMGINLFHL